jgi:hypothetical protein
MFSTPQVIPIRSGNLWVDTDPLLYAAASGVDSPGQAMDKLERICKFTRGSAGSLTPVFVYTPSHSIKAGRFAVATRAKYQGQRRPSNGFRGSLICLATS